MNTLIINGSPRSNGHTATLLHALERRLSGTATVVDTYTARIAPCNDCRACWHTARCVIDDGMTAVYDAINAADTIVLASPVHFGELTGSLLQWASRLQVYWAARYRLNREPLTAKRRVGAVLLTAGSTGPFDTALATANRLLSVLHADARGHIVLPDTDDLSPADWRQNAALSAEINRLVDALTTP